MLVRTLPLLCCAMTACDAARHPTPEPQRATRLYWHDGLMFGFEIPAAWLEQREGAALVFSGARHTTSHFTTLSVQSVSDDGSDLLSALDAACGPAMQRVPFTWLAREPAIIAGRPAVRYTFEVELHESRRRKHGVLVDVGTHLIDIAYAATPALFASGLPVFDHALATLHVEAIPDD